jgi:hypothetical protein
MVALIKFKVPSGVRWCGTLNIAEVERKEKRNSVISQYALSRVEIGPILA